MTPWTSGVSPDSCGAQALYGDLGVSDRPSVGGGKFITETFDYDGGRQVTVYVPQDPPEAMVFAGDGQVLASWAADLEGTDVPATMVVGVHRLADETLRLHEYSPGSTSGP